MSASPNGAICPSCGRFVGPLEACPYCGAAVRKRLPLRYLRLGSILFALLGLAALLYAVSGTATPRVTVASIAATMNYAYVRLEGIVTRGPVYDPATQELHFYLADTTGEILVSSFRATTNQLIDQKKIPAAGDHVAVEGTLRVREDFVSLNLASPDKLDIAHPEPHPLKIGDLGRDHNLQAITISGDVREITSPYTGLTLISVGDASGEVDVAVYADVLALTGSLPAMQPGDAVQVNGTVTLYKDTPQLTLTDAQGLKKLAEDAAPVTTSQIGELDAARIGTRVAVAANVAGTQKFSQGWRVMLDDGSGTITLLLWQDTFAQIADADQLKKGARVQALGKLSEYHGELELTPAHASDVQIVAVATAMDATPVPTRTPTAAAVERTIGTLAKSDADQLVTISGRIIKASSFSSGMRYTLDDGTGTITLLLWSDVVESVKNSEAFKVGARVQATGQVSVYNGALEVAPGKGSDVVLLALSAIPTPAPRAIASLSTDDVGTAVVVKGTAAKVTDFSKGKYVTLGDGSGKVQVVVYSNVLNTIPDQDKLIAGASLTVVGQVNLYRGELEVVPEEGGVILE
jgi:DNA/RNA endonuclease YhcR with UshA esterase domain